MTTYSRPIFNIPVSFSSSSIVYKTVAFTSPSNLTSSGVFGGDNFAVKSGFCRHPNVGGTGAYEENDDTVSNHPTWHAFDSSMSTFCVIQAYPNYPGYLYIYNPDPINIESMVINMRSSTYGIRSFTLQYSDDGENWSNIEYFNAGSTSPSTWNITVTPYSGYHKYYRFEIDRGSRDSLSYRNVQMSNIVITGTKKVASKRLYLYRYGDECIDVTGGWNIVDHNNVTVTKESNYFYFVKSSGTTQNGGLITQNKIDFSGWESVHMDFEDCVTISNTSEVRVNCCASNSSTSNTTYWLLSNTYGNNAHGQTKNKRFRDFTYSDYIRYNNRTPSYSIVGDYVTTPQYVYAGHYSDYSQTGYAKIYAIWLERIVVPTAQNSQE